MTTNVGRQYICLFYPTLFSRYAEEVEARLRSIGLVCNIGYPPIDLPVAEVIDRITRAGTLYVIVVSAQNAIHRSCTLNILHGARQGLGLFLLLSFVKSFFIRW